MYNNYKAVKVAITAAIFRKAVAIGVDGSVVKEIRQRGQEKCKRTYLSLILIAVLVLTSLFSHEKMSYANLVGVNKFTNKTSETILNIIQDTKNPKRVYSELVGVFLGVMDVEWIGRFVLARKWTDIPPNLQSTYLKVYANYLAAFYAIKFKDYHGQQVQIINTKSAANKRYLVTTMVIDKRDNSKKEIAYRVQESGDGMTYKIRDIIIEGISLLSAQRSEFSSFVSSNGIEELMQVLKARTVQYNASVNGGSSR